MQRTRSNANGKRAGGAGQVNFSSFQWVLHGPRGGIGLLRAADITCGRGLPDVGMISHHVTGTAEREIRSLRDALRPASRASRVRIT